MKTYLFLLALGSFLSLSGCDNLAKGTRLKPEEQSQFFNNGTSARVPPAHSIARGELHSDTLLYTGRNPDGSLATQFPWPVTKLVLARGQQQYLAICANCHGADGYGHGIIVARGFPQPPSYHGAKLSGAPVGHYFEVMTNGYGAMFPYANIVSVNDRWAIAAYIRALQRSQHATEKDMPLARLNELKEGARPMSRRFYIGLIGLVAAIAAIIFGIFQPAAFYHSYLFAVLAWLNPALGCLLLIFIHRMTGGKWGETLQPLLAAGAATVPWALLFAVPLFFGMDYLFPWTVAHPNSLFARHSIYLSSGGYIIRGVVYVFIYLWLIGLSRRRGTPWTGPVGMILYVLTTYLLSVDWVVALEPGWYSTGFPVVLMASQAVSALALSIAGALWLRPPAPSDRGSRRNWLNLGNLMLAALMFWAYVSYADLLIIWSSNLPPQSAWYVHRNAGGWHWILIILVLLNLVAPVLCLLSSSVKSRSRGFAVVTWGVVVFQILYLYWLILPAFRTTGIEFHASDVLTPIALGGLYLFFYLGNASKEVARHA